MNQVVVELEDEEKESLLSRVGLKKVSAGDVLAHALKNAKDASDSRQAERWMSVALMAHSLVEPRPPEPASVPAVEIVQGS